SRRGQRGPLPSFRRRFPGRDRHAKRFPGIDTHSGSEKTNTLLPRLKSICVFPPAPTATYCLPSTMYVTGGAFTPAPHWYVQSTLPDRASYALKRPLPSPANARSPPVTLMPPIIGWSVFACQAIFPVLTSTAVTFPVCGTPGMVLNAPPSQSFPSGYWVASTW